MATQIFVNLPVRNLQKSVEFFTRLGYTFDQRFTDENATCMVVSDDIHVMLLTEAYFQGFAPNPICDARKNTEVLIALSCESREHVHEMVRKAVAAGATTYSEPKDYGFMLQHGYQDPDGHVWELFYMEPDATPSGAA